MEDNDEDEMNIVMVLGQLQDLIDANPLPRSLASGSYERKILNIERTRVIMDEQMFVDYFPEVRVWGPAFFCRCHCMRKLLLLTIMKKVCEWDNYCTKEGCLQFSGFIITPQNKVCAPNACTWYVSRCLRRLLPD